MPLVSASLMKVLISIPGQRPREFHRDPAHNAGGIGAFDRAPARAASLARLNIRAVLVMRGARGGIAPVTPFGSSSFGLLASSGFNGVARRSDRSRWPCASRETNIQPSVADELILLGKRSETVI